jgi:branched-chain amino acid transport system substrate-binding protein
MKRLFSLTALAVVFGCGCAQAQYSDGSIKIGVMNDMSGTYSDLSGQGSVIAARMAVEDFGAAAKGMKVEIVGADHQNKPDVGSNVVRTWIDVDKVDVIVDVPNVLRCARSQRDRARQEQGISRLRRGGLGSDRPQMHSQYDPLDL